MWQLSAWESFLACGVRFLVDVGGKTIISLGERINQDDGDNSDGRYWWIVNHVSRVFQRVKWEIVKLEWANLRFIKSGASQNFNDWRPLPTFYGAFFIMPCKKCSSITMAIVKNLSAIKNLIWISKSPQSRSFPLTTLFLADDISFNSRH